MNVTAVKMIVIPMGLVLIPLVVGYAFAKMASLAMEPIVLVSDNLGRAKMPSCRNLQVRVNIFIFTVDSTSHGLSVTQALGHPGCLSDNLDL